MKIIKNEYSVLYKNDDDKYHREDGPALELSNLMGSMTGIKAWWYNGEFLGNSKEGYTQEKFERWKFLKVFL